MVEVGASEPAQYAPKRIYMKHVEGMRAAAALVVYVNHAIAQSLGPNHDLPPPPALSPFSYFFVAGHLSVTVFIVISGFCLALPVLQNGDEIPGGSLAFFKRRARRILPPYYGAVALSLALIGTILGDRTGTLWDIPILVSPVAIASHLFLLQDIIATGSINYVLWSIAVECHIYLLFPLLVKTWRRRGPVITVGAAVVASYVVSYAVHTTRFARAMPHFVGMFALGMLAAYIALSSREPYATARTKLPWGWMCLAGLSIACLLTAEWGIALARLRFHWLDLPIGVMTASALVLSSRSESSLLRRAFSWTPLSFIGTFSYSLYLIHAPLLQLIWKYVLVPRNLSEAAIFAFLMTAGLIVVLGAAYLFFLGLEAPFLRKASRPVATVMPAT